MTLPALHPWTGIYLLDDTRVEQHLEQQLPGWTFEKNATPARISRSWGTSDFISAIRLLGIVSLLAEAANHHPDVALGWGYLRISWTTHDLGGIHANDLLLAAETDRLLDEAH